jgi:hypothetical protein
VWLNKSDSDLYLLVTGIILGIILVGFLVQGAISTFEGLLSLQTRPARLISDFTALEGAVAALVNSGLVAAVGLVLVKVNRVLLSGPTVAAVFTMMGFALFGKTVLNILPIITGVYVASKGARKTFAT